MRNIFSCFIVASLFFSVACTQKEKVYNAEELSSGDAFGEFTIKSISPDEYGGFNMVLEDEITVKDTLERAPMGNLGVKSTILSGKIKFGDDTLDLGRHYIYFQNPILLALYFDTNMIEETPDGKTTFTGGATAEMVLTNIQIDPGVRDIVTAKISRVLAVNGQQNPEIKEATLVRFKNSYEYILRARINKLASQEPFNDGLFFTNDITEFLMYKEDESFRNFVDNLMSYGYGIEQAEGEYYLYLGEPANYQDGEMDTLPSTLTVEDLKEMESFNGLVIDEFKYSPRDFLDMKFSGQFEISGQLYFDGMWSEIGFIADDESPYATELEVEGFTFKTMQYMKFFNEKELKSALEDGQFEKLQAGDNIPVTLSAKDYSLEVAHEKGAFQKTEFIEFVD